MPEYLINGKVYERPYAPENPQQVLEVISPVILWSDWTSVLTATTSLQSATFSLTGDTWLKSVSIVPSADAVTNGLSACVSIQANTSSVLYYPSTAQPSLNSLRNISAIFNLTIDPPYGQFLPRGTKITLFYAATGGSSTVQLVCSGVQAGTGQYPNGVS